MAPASCSTAQYPIVKIKPYTDCENIAVFMETANKIKKTSKQLFMIDGTKVAIVFNPTTPGKTEILGIDVGNKVALVSEKRLSAQMVGAIRAIIPSKYQIAQLVLPPVNGKPIFQYLGLE